MGKRIVSGAALLLVALGVIWAGGEVLAAVILLISCIAYRELNKAIGVHKEKGIDPLELFGYLAIICYDVLTYVSWKTGKDLFLYICILLFATLLTFMAVYVITFPRYRAERVMSSFFCLLYAPAMLEFIFKTRCMDHGMVLVWLIFIASSVSDTFAYFVGVTLGKHKLAPVLSPKKSIEGAVGGIVGTALFGAGYGYLVGEGIFSMGRMEVALNFAVLCGIGSVIAQIGDLAASGIKRDHEIKDYGTCIPGHGGIMDRFDSVLFTAPIIYYLARVMLSR